MQYRGAVVTEIEIAKLEVALQRGNGAKVGRGISIGNFRLRDQDLVEPSHRSGAALKEVNDPSKGNNRPGKLHNVGHKGDKVTGGYMVEHHFATTQPEGNNDADAQHELQAGPEHSSQTRQGKSAVYIFNIRGLEQRYFGFFLGISANHPGSGKILLGARRDFGKLRLDLFEAFVNLASKILDDHAGHRQRYKGKHGEPGAGAPHEE